MQRVDSTIEVSIDSILQWAIKFEKLLSIQSKSKSNSKLDGMENDGKFCCIFYYC